MEKEVGAAIAIFDLLGSKSMAEILSRAAGRTRFRAEGGDMGGNGAKA